MTIARTTLQRLCSWSSLNRNSLNLIKSWLSAHPVSQYLHQSLASVQLATFHWLEWAHTLDGLASDHEMRKINTAVETVGTYYTPNLWHFRLSSRSPYIDISSSPDSPCADCRCRLNSSAMKTLIAFVKGSVVGHVLRASTTPPRKLRLNSGGDPHI